MKPDGVQVRHWTLLGAVSIVAHAYRLPQRALVGSIISRFENRGFKLAAIKLVTPSKEHLEKHYADLSSKPFFPGLIACTFILVPPLRWNSKILRNEIDLSRCRYGLRPRVCHGLGRPRCRQDGPCYPRCHQPACFCSGHHPRGLRFGMF